MVVDAVFSVISANKPIDTVWGQTYYTYLTDIKEENKYEEAGLPENADYMTFGFYEIDNMKNPVMIME